MAPVAWFNTNSDRVADPKKANSSIRRKNPGTGTGAFPDLLGSSGTANKPQIVAAIIGSPPANTTLIRPSVRLQKRQCAQARDFKEKSYRQICRANIQLKFIHGIVLVQL